MGSGLVVEADEQGLARVVGNLLAIAVRHAAHRVKVSLDRNGANVVMTFADDGLGIPAEDREGMFVRFDTHRARAAGGAGLALAIVRDLVTDMGGSVTIEKNDRWTGAGSSSGAR